jgi:flagellar M-ring protein FliF
MGTILGLLQQLRETFGRLSASQRMLFTGAAVLLAATLAYTVYMVNQVEYVSLFARLSESDTAAVVEALKKNKIPYRLSDTGTVMVPKDQLYDVRLSVATEGVPRGAGAGFEIFDQQKLGSTEFVQKINYQRALQGELSRSINQMNEVMESRVHLVLPEDSLFLEDRKPTSASVVLKLNPGSRLNQRQVQGIVHLVANAVKGLDEEHVTILSTDGQVIFKKSPSDNPAQVSGTQLDFKNQLEENLRQKVQTMLEQVVGANRVIARVTADVDFNQIRTEQDTYDPDSTVVRSQQKSIENTEGAEATPKGNPDVPINIESKLMESPAAAKDQQKKFNRQRETVNYEINHVSKKVVNSPGTVKKLSVAVIVDGPYETKTEAGKPKLAFVARSADEMKGLEDLVKKAVGYDDARNDQVSVSNVPFAPEAAAIEEPQGFARWLQIAKGYQKIAWNVVLVILIFFFVIRPLLRKLQQIAKDAPSLPLRETPGMLPPGEEMPGFPQERFEIPVDSLPALRDRAVNMIQHDPDKARDILRTWLRED